MHLRTTSFFIRWKRCPSIHRAKRLPSRSYGVKHDIPTGQWNALRVVFKDNLFTVFLNGERLFEAEDQTFTEAGKVGLWTKADSLTYFADFSFVKQ